MSKRPTWSTPLPRPITIPKVMTLKTLADVHALLRHIPADRRKLMTWRHVEKTLQECAVGEDNRRRRIGCSQIFSDPSAFVTHNTAARTPLHRGRRKMVSPTISGKYMANASANGGWKLLSQTRISGTEM